MIKLIVNIAYLCSTILFQFNDWEGLTSIYLNAIRFKSFSEDSKGKCTYEIRNQQIGLVGLSV